MNHYRHATRRISTCAALCLTPLILLAFPGTHAQEPNPKIQGNISDVLASGLFLYKTDQTQEKLMLYGIDTFELNKEQRRTLNEHLSERLTGKPAQISLVHETGGLKYVRLYAPDDIAAQLIQDGFVHWDKMLAADELEYESMERFAKTQELGIWEKSVEPEATAVGDALANSLDIPKDLQLYLKQIRKSLEFEAALDRWSRLSPTNRAKYRDGFSQRAMKGLTKKEDDLSRLGSADARLENRQTANQQSSQTSRNRISESRQNEQNQVQQVYDDSDLDEKIGFLNQSIRERNDGLIVGYYDYKAFNAINDYQNRIGQERNRIAGQTRGISARSEAERAAYYNEVARLEEENRRLGVERDRVHGLNEARSTNLRMQNARNTRESNLLHRLDQAIQFGYRYTSTFSDYARYPHANEYDEITIPATLNFIVVNWDPVSSNSGIDVFRGTQTIPFTRLLNKTPFYKRFYIFEPGYQYVLKPREAARIELRYMDLIEPDQQPDQNAIDQTSLRSLPSNSSTKSAP